MSMRKKISIDQLRLGMFVDELCGSWMDHPFWNKKFLLNNATALAKIVASPVREAWIDTSKGLDVAAATPAVTAPEPANTPPPAPITPPLVIDPRVSIQVEVERATRICNKAKTAITAMFQEARMGRAIEPAALAPLVDEIASSVQRNPSALVSLARLKTKDDYTYLHSVAVCGLMISLARQLNVDEKHIREIGLAGLVHDLGKAAIPLEILNKPGKLTDDEFKVVQNHPFAGHEMLLEGGGVGEIPLDVARHHHEKIDGTGYPDRLSGERISLFAKMGAVCDVYDAITSNRPYKAGWSPAESLHKMATWSTGHFDKIVFQAFVKCIGIYPIASLVRLESGLLAVVIEHSSTNSLTPIVKTFYCTKRKARRYAQIIDLSQCDGQDKIAGWESPSNWNFPDLEEMWSGIAAPTETRAAAKVG